MEVAAAYGSSALSQFNAAVEASSVPITTAVLGLGGLLTAKKTFGWLWRRVVGPTIVGEVAWREMGDWAIVTGSSQGIGYHYAKELAARGLNIILIADNAGGLEKVSLEIRNRFNVQTKVIVVDFNNGMDAFETIRSEIGSLDVGVLINNVAVDLPYKTFDQLDGESIKKCIDVNVTTATVMTNMVLAKMLRKRRGVVVNFGSFVGEANCPMPTVYPTSKSACHKFTRDMQVWYKDSGVIFQTVLPGIVATPMAFNVAPTLFIPTPERYASSLVKTVGWEDTTTGYIPHDLQLGLMRLLNCVFGDYSMIKYLPYVPGTKYLRGNKYKTKQN